MERIFRIFSIVLFTLTLSILMVSISTARAVTVVDPDAFPAGTVLNNAYPGVTLSAWGDPGVLLNNHVIALVSPYASTGTMVFGDNEPANPDSWGDGDWDYLRADFSSGALWVSLDFICNDSVGDNNAELIAYDSSGVEIDRDGPYFVASGAFLTLTVNGPDIAYVEAYWDNILRVENGVLDNLMFESVIEVDIDIKPGSYPSSINLKKKGVIPVAIHTTPDFDATTVDPTTVLLNDLVYAINWEIYDCDEIPNPEYDPILNPDVPEMIGDGDLDLVVYFSTPEVVNADALQEGDTEATLTGETFDGIPIKGTGDVRIIVKK